MSTISDDELKKFVEQVVERTLSAGQTESAGMAQSSSQAITPSETTKVIALGSDHGGFLMKEMLIRELIKARYQIIDCGTQSLESVDYPDFAFAVADMVRSGKAWRGILVDGAGIGSCMAANKVSGVRAALCYDHATAVNSREHNDSNVLTLGAGLIGDALARQIVETWLKTEFAGGRHARRVQKIMDIEITQKTTGNKNVAG